MADVILVTCRRWQDILGGSFVGVLLTPFGIIDMATGEIRVGGGNEWTLVVTGVGALAGAMVGATSFFRHHVFSFLLLGLGLVAAIALRDEYRLQPPVVFVNIFGIPFIGVAIGTLLDRWRATKTPHPSTVVIVGCALVTAVAVFTVAIQGLSGRVVAEDCETTEAVSHCKLFP